MEMYRIRFRPEPSRFKIVIIKKKLLFAYIHIFKTFIYFALCAIRLTEGSF